MKTVSDYLIDAKIALMKRRGRYYIEINGYLILFDLGADELTREVEKSEFNEILTPARDIAMQLEWDRSCQYLRDAIQSIDSIFDSKVKIGQTFKNSDGDDLLTFDYYGWVISVVIDETTRLAKDIVCYADGRLFSAEEKIVDETSLVTQLKLAKCYIDNQIVG